LECYLVCHSHSQISRQAKCNSKAEKRVSKLSEAPDEGQRRRLKARNLRWSLSVTFIRRSMSRVGVLVLLLYFIALIYLSCITDTSCN
jgi:hypothetical protein